MKHVLLGAMLATLAACGAAPHDAPATPPAKTKTVFDPLLQQRDKAQELAHKLPDERKENLDHAIEAESQ